MLEYASLELEDRIDQELEENPALEEIEEFPAQEDEQEVENDLTEQELTIGDYLTEDDIPDYRLQENNFSKDPLNEDVPYSEVESFQEYLLAQLYLRNLSEYEMKIGKYLIGTIEGDGYLRRDLLAIADDYAFQYGVDVPLKDVQKVLSVIKDFDPPGLAARNLQECLLLQLAKKKKTSLLQLTSNILENFFEEFSKKHYEKIEKSLGITSQDIRDVIKEITLLNPKPGSSWESSLETKMSQVIPDFTIEASNGELFFSMNERNIPQLRVNREYSDMFEDYAKNKSNQSFEKKEALFFVKQKLDAAKWFIDSVKQRQNTLRSTMLAIIEIQKDFFLYGEEPNLKPMILKDVAELSNYDISTVSRVSNSKYVQTNYGVYPLKYFFSESLTNGAGEEVSTREVKAILKACIEREDKKKPLTDDALVGELKKQGYEVARRTIAKYREQLNLPVARLRKEL
ncbi:RNA polymerase sigma 54 factor RpoN [Bacteroidales bacterium]|nr:RNA polymerase sigma 54 factor RpoN [Bacteroidales bacterium]